MTTKGEAIAIGIAQMSTVEMSSCDHGVVAKVKRCIMERDLYPKRWGMGPVALEKKKMKADGTLDKYGRTNENTPAKWNSNYVDYSAPGAAGAAAPKALDEPVAETTSQADVQSAPPVAPTGMDLDTPPAAPKDKKRKHDGETAEEKAERKRRKEEKKAKKAEKARRKSGGAKDDDDDDSD